MGYIIEISEDEVESLAENTEKMLRYGGKVMQCVDKMRRNSEDDDESRSGERHGYRDTRDYRGGMRDRYERDYDRDDRYGERGNGGRRY